VAITVSANAGQAAADPNALYADRGNLANAARAAELWAADLQRDPKQFDAAWKLARAKYWLGGHLPDAQQKRAFEDGIRAARQAIAAQPSKPEGTSGSRPAWRARRVVRSAPGSSAQGNQGRAADGAEDRRSSTGGRSRAGPLVHKVPGLFGGSNRKSEEHLRNALAYNPNSIIDDAVSCRDARGRGQSRARAVAQKALDAPLDPDWIRPRVQDPGAAATGQTALGRILVEPSPLFFPSRPASTIRFSSGGGACAGSRNSSNMMFAVARRVGPTKSSSVKGPIG
jgi:hypothetical protein